MKNVTHVPIVTYKNSNDKQAELLRRFCFLKLTIPLIHCSLEGSFILEENNLNIISVEEARTVVTELKDRLGRPIDPGIAEALIHFVRFTQALGFQTTQSCEGHIDWGLPFPWIDFQIPHGEVLLPPWWKVWKIRQRLRGKREEERHFRNEEKKADQLCVMMTRYLVRYEQMHGGDPETALHINRWNHRTFRLKAVHSWLSEGYKASADDAALDQLLVSQRKAMYSFALFCLEQLAREPNLVGIPEEGCPGCMGRG